MTISTGAVQYLLETSPVTGYSFSHYSSELDSAMSGLVEEVVFDDSGKAKYSVATRWDYKNRVGQI